MKTRRLRLLLFALWLPYSLGAQNVFNDISLSAGSSDNSGRSTAQSGLEVLRSSRGVTFEAGAYFEHVGQFYLAQDGIWNPTGMASTDYFGYAPNEFGSYTPYQGVGIMGASPNNGGLGAGRPTFGHIQLNSTGPFPVVAGMHITHSLAFNANGPAKSCIVTTPNMTSPTSHQNAVSFSSTATITGVDALNYIDGFATVNDVTGKYTLPIGDSTDPLSPLHPLTINKVAQGTVTARYLHTNPYSTDERGVGIGSVSRIGSWPISAPSGTQVTLNIPSLGVSPEEAINLRLVGWNSHQWVDLSGSATTGACTTGDCPLTGTVQADIIALAVGSTNRSLASTGEQSSASLTLWPNPTQGQLNMRISNGQEIQAVHVLDSNGRSVLKSRQATPILNTTALPTGNYILEVQTLQGQTLRKPFVKQP